MEVAATPTYSSGGTIGGIDEACTLTSTTQIAASGSLTSVSATVAGGALVATSLHLLSPGIIIGDAGLYTQGPPGAGNGVYKEAFSGCGFASRNYPTLSVSYGVAQEQIDPGTGIYAETTVPCSGGGMPSTTDGGKGLTLTYTAGDLFYGTVSYGTDNTPVFQKYALGATASTPNPGSMNDQAAKQQPRCVYIPAGNYLTKPLNLGGNYSGNFVAHGFGCWIGDEHYHSNLFIVPNYGGDVFAFLDSNMNNSLVSLGNTQLFANTSPTTDPTIVPGPDMAGSGVRNLTIIGDRLSTKLQNAMVFYGTTEFVNIDNVVVNYLNGSAVLAGVPDSTGNASLKESIIQNSRFEFTGSSVTGAGSNPPNGFTAATIEISAASGNTKNPTEGSNNVSFSNNRIYQSLGTAFWIHNGKGVGNDTRSMRISGLKIEGSNIALTTEGGDLLEIGDPATTFATLSSSAVSDILGRNIDLVNAVTGYAALHIAGAAATGSPKVAHESQFMDIEGAITDGGYARGVQSDTCQQCFVKMASNGSGDYNLAIGVPGAGGVCTVASASKFSLKYDGNGPEQMSGGLTTCLDTIVAMAVTVPTVHPYAP